MFAERRAQLMEAMRSESNASAAIFASAHLTTRNSDVDHEFRQESTFYYLTGFDEPDTVALIRPGAEAPFVLFVRPHDPEMAIWVGARAGVDGALERYGADDAYPIDELAERLPALLAEVEDLYYPLGSDDEVELRNVRRLGSFLGLIDKLEYRFNLGIFSLISRWKSEYRRDVPVARSGIKRRELSQLFGFMARWPVMRSSFLESGVEYILFKQLRNPTPPGAEDSHRELVIATQLANLSDYQGYRLTTLLGFEVARRYVEAEKTRTRVRGFVSIFAGVER